MSITNQKLFELLKTTVRASQHEIALVQEDLSNNSLVALIFLTFINGVIEFLVIYYGVDTWFVIGVMAFIFFTTIMLSLISMVYFLGKHIRLAICIVFSRANSTC